MHVTAKGDGQQYSDSVESEQVVGGPQRLEAPGRPTVLGSTITWNVVANATRYRLRWGKVNEDSHVLVTLEATQLSYTLPMLEAGASYDIMG